MPLAVLRTVHRLLIRMLLPTARASAATPFSSHLLHFQLIQDLSCIALATQVDEHSQFLVLELVEAALGCKHTLPVFVCSPLSSEGFKLHLVKGRLGPIASRGLPPQHVLQLVSSCDRGFNRWSFALCPARPGLGPRWDFGSCLGRRVGRGSSGGSSSRCSSSSSSSVS